MNDGTINSATLSTAIDIAAKLIPLALAIVQVRRSLAADGLTPEQINKLLVDIASTVHTNTAETINALNAIPEKEG